MPNSKLLICATTAVLGFAVTFGACCKRAQGKPRAETCAAAYEAAQELRSSAKLRRAEVMLLVCARESCGKFIHGECTSWLEQVQLQQPSVILSATDGTGARLDNVAVSLDGVPLTSTLNGVAIVVDPGSREFRFEASGHHPVLQRVNIVQGQKNQPIEAHFEGPAPAAEPTPDPAGSDRAARSSRSSVPYVIGGVGVLGAVGFGVFGTLAKNERQSLRDCLPDCARTKAERVSSFYAAANVSLGVGVVGLGTATILFLTWPGSSTTRASTPTHNAKLQSIDVRQTPGGVLAEARGTF